MSRGPNLVGHTKRGGERETVLLRGGGGRKGFGFRNCRLGVLRYLLMRGRGGGIMPHHAHWLLTTIAPRGGPNLQTIAPGYLQVLAAHDDGDPNPDLACHCALLLRFCPSSTPSPLQPAGSLGHEALGHLSCVRSPDYHHAAASPALGWTHSFEGAALQIGRAHV